MSSTFHEPTQAAENEPTAAQDYDIPHIPKGTRLTDAAAEEFGAKIEKAYRRGASISFIIEKSGRSYGCIHRTLRKRGVPMRPRGYAPKVSPSALGVPAAGNQGPAPGPRPHRLT
ncbi:helix-turn-helix domain-containing protein [Streptomyces sp. NPDC005962]|uniref:helix-turn-helix domain-containing protein n=1 Tax=Streptomyces sp. NPDC005962 TaxID=3154466 RepID=UPI0033ED2264